MNGWMERKEWRVLKSRRRRKRKTRMTGEGKVEDEVFSSDPPEQLPQGRRSAAQEMKSCGNAVESQEGKT